MEELNQETSTSPEEQKQLPPVTSPEGVAPQPKEGAEVEEVKETPTPPPERTYSEAEIRKMHSSFDTQTNLLKEKHKEELKQVREQLVAQQRTQFLAQVEAEGGDTVKAGREFDREQTNIAKEQELTALAQVLDTAKKDRDADGYISKFGLSTDAKDELLKAENPAEMRSKALEMALEASKATKTPPVKTPSAVTTGKGFDASKATPRERAEAYFREQEGG